MRPAPPPEPEPESQEAAPRITQEFWDSAPVYSEPPESLPSKAPARASRGRRGFAIFLFIVLFTPVLLLFAHVVAIKFNFSWLVVGTQVAEFAQAWWEKAVSLVSR